MITVGYVQHINWERLWPGAEDHRLGWCVGVTTLQKDLHRSGSRVSLHMG